MEMLDHQTGQLVLMAADKESLQTALFMVLKLLPLQGELDHLILVAVVAAVLKEMPLINMVETVEVDL